MKILVDLQKSLEDTAHKIAKDEPDPDRWDTAILYLMEALEVEAEEQENGLGLYEGMLHKIWDALRDRIEEKTWSY